MTDTILVVDDEEFNLSILGEHLSDAGYNVVKAEDGIIAIEKLTAHPEIDLVLLDRMMPRLNGMEVLDKIKKDPQYKELPVIMQTAAAGSTQVLEGIQAGVYYYLTKPYTEEILLSLVSAALQDSLKRYKLRDQLKKQLGGINYLKNAEFEIKNLEDAENLAYFLANCFPHPEATILGLNEILVNSIEHGNLGITYAEKKQLMMNSIWQESINAKLLLPEHIAKYVKVILTMTDSEVTVKIIDQGNGFDWRKFMEISADRATDPNGRGIAHSRLISFDKIEYLGKGNEVICTVFKNKS